MNIKSTVGTTESYACGDRVRPLMEKAMVGEAGILRLQSREVQKVNKVIYYQEMSERLGTIKEEQ